LEILWDISLDKFINYDNFGQLPTRGDIQLPGSAFANDYASGYLSRKQTSQHNGTATEYTTNVRHNQASFDTRI